MNPRKNTLACAIAMAMGGAFSVGAQAALTTSATLQFTAGETFCTAFNSSGKCIATDVTGTYFSMDWQGDGTVQPVEKEPFAPGTDGGIHIGTLQTAGQIDSGWTILQVPGNAYTTTPVTVVGDFGATKTLDFSGWTLYWNGISISMGGDTANFGDTGLATVVCSASSCSGSSTFTLDYSAHVALNDPSYLGGILYNIHMVGVVSSVPVPAAAWLFGSGLLGLIGMARRKATCTVM